MATVYDLPLLDPRSHPTKTIDFGRDGTSCSLTTYGRFISIAGYHPLHGQVLAEPWDQFPAEQHHDQVFVRKYRARGIEAHDQEDEGFGLSFGEIDSKGDVVA
jgi:hypothetical protein